MTRALYRYLLRLFVAGQRYVGPLVVLLLVNGMILAAPPLDASAALLAAITQMGCSMWLAYLAIGMESPAQEHVTITRCGSRLAPWLAKLAVAITAGLPTPVVTVTLAAATGHVPHDAVALWVVAVLVPTISGTALGALVREAFPRRAGYAALTTLTTVVADIAIPWAPPLAPLATVGRAGNAGAGLGWMALAWAVVGGLLLASGALTAAWRIHDRP